MAPREGLVLMNVADVLMSKKAAEAHGAQETELLKTD
jgi:hypothetical protein